MKKGETIRVYEDPITQKRFEGKAKLVKLIDSEFGFWDGRRLMRWQVRFENDKGLYERDILEPTVLKGEQNGN